MNRNGGTLFAWLVGLGDAATGLVLLAAPALFLRLFGFEPLPGEALVFVRWIGTFVLAVGCAYLLPFAEREPERAARLRGALSWTAAARLLVAAFVAVAVLSGALVVRWCFVGAYDGVVAIAQLALLSRGAFGAEVE